MDKVINILNKLTITNCGKVIVEEDKQKIMSSINSLLKSVFIFRYVDNKYLHAQFQSDLGNIEVLSKHLFLYGDKGKLFYEDLNQKTYNLDINEIDCKNFEFIYNKLTKVFVDTENLTSKDIQVAISNLSNIQELRYFFSHTRVEEWCYKIAQLCENDKLIIKDYYVSILHTIGLAGYGRNTYFLSTSTNYDFCEILRKRNREMHNEDGIIILGWTSKREYVKTFGSKSYSLIKRLGFPLIESPIFPKQHEITLKCGLLPHFIIGYLYDDKFEINPYVLTVDSIDKKGLPVDQKDFLQNISLTNLKYYYSVCDGIYWQQGVHNNKTKE